MVAIQKAGLGLGQIRTGDESLATVRVSGFTSFEVPVFFVETNKIEC